MVLDAFRTQLRERGGAADIWLVYLADPFEEVQGGRIVLTLQRAFWTRGEAYAFAEGSRQEKRWQQFYVFRIAATSWWAEGSDGIPTAFEMQFGRTRLLPFVSVRPTEVAAVMTAAST